MFIRMMMMMMMEDIRSLRFTVMASLLLIKSNGMDFILLLQVDDD